MGDLAFISEKFIDGKFISKFTHKNSLQCVIGDMTQDDFELLIQLAANAITTMNTSVKTIQYKEALTKELEKHTLLTNSEKQQIEDKLRYAAVAATKEKEHLVSKHSQEISYLRQQIDELKGLYSISESTALKYKEQFNEISQKSEAAFTKSISEIAKQKDIQHEKEIKRIQETHERILENADKTARERVQQCDTQYKETIANIKLTYAELEAKINKEREKMFISSEKGKQGERDFDAIAAEHTKWGPLQNTSKTPHCADRRCSIKGCDTLFELKEYSSDVPSKEVEKFHRDMEEHPECPLGVFISYNTNIAGKQSGNGISMSWSPKMQLLLYVNQFYSHSVPDVMNFIEIAADIAFTMNKLSNDKPEESQVTIALNSRIVQAKHIVETELKRVAEFINTLTLNKKILVETIAKNYTDNTLQITHTKESLKLMLDILLGKHADKPLPEAILQLAVTSEPVKKKRVSKKQATIVLGNTVALDR